VAQINYERGLWLQDMHGKMTETDIKKKERKGVRGQPWKYNPLLDAALVLSNCADFKYEKSELQELVESRGHILLISVKCHPEMAGVGVEYCWGKLKYEHRHRNCQKDKRKSGQEFKDNITRLCKDETILPMTRIWKFSRRTREYMMLYMDYNERSSTSECTYKHITHKELEDMKQKCKTHRNIMELEKSFLDATD